MNRVLGVGCGVTPWSRYIFLFQLPCLGELLLSCYDFNALNKLFSSPPFTAEDGEAYLWALSNPGQTT